MSLHLSEPARFAPVPPPEQPANRAFISVPAPRSGADIPWLTRALATAVVAHDRVLVVLESELASYERCATPHQVLPRLQLAEEAELVAEHTMAGWHQVDAVRRQLPYRDGTRVHIAAWTHFVDSNFATLWRHLLAAFAVTSAFRQDVLELGHAALREGRILPGALHAERMARAACFREVESLAMRLRVAETAGYCHEYGPLNDGMLAQRLYDNAYAADGLTVESTLGQPAQRVYHHLP